MSSTQSYGPDTLQALRTSVVGRGRELELITAALMGRRHLVLEGPPGTGKSTLLRAVADASNQPFDFVEGNAELTPARLVGHFDPAQVLESGYSEQVWVDGPLARALREGGLLYLEEINRIPEETLNVLVTVMSEGDLTVPRLGRIDAHPEFRLVAAMNPFDAVGTARISGAIYDRICRVSMEYQSATDELDIAARHVAELDAGFASKIVDLVRATRTHRDVRVGSSVRGAIDTLILCRDLASLRSMPSDSRAVALDAAITALSGRIQVHDSATLSPEQIITELYDAIVDAPDEADGDGDNGDTPGADPGKARASQPATTPTTNGS